MTDGTSPSESPEKGRLIHLDERECWELLLLETLGRLAVSTPDGPEIFPVNYSVADDSIVVGTDPGVKLSHSSFDHVALEVDSLDHSRHTGWVVMAKGHAEDITDKGDAWSTRLLQVAIRSWVDAPHSHRVAMVRPKLTGRRLIPKG